VLGSEECCSELFIVNPLAVQLRNQIVHSRTAHLPILLRINHMPFLARNSL
jgi:hypothetical protein